MNIVPLFDPGANVGGGLYDLGWAPGATTTISRGPVDVLFVTCIVARPVSYVVVSKVPVTWVIPVVLGSKL